MNSIVLSSITAPIASVHINIIFVFIVVFVNVKQYHLYTPAQVFQS